MTQREIGRIQEVNIREVWPNEASDFTPWLAENLEVLGEELGMVLELKGIEVPVGNYYLDILANEANRDAAVAIENQIAVTDNPHLGQLLTYAAGTKAKIVIWIATEFRDEHRAALDWLNEGTGESLDFFGVEVGAIKISNSIPAPLFRLAAAPNHWSKKINSIPSELTETQAKYVRFWKPLLEKLNREHEWNVMTENRQSAYNAGSGLGFGQFGRTMRLTSEGEARVELVILAPSRSWNKAAFDLLIESKEQIEGEFGPMIWERLDDYQSSRVGVSRKASVDGPEAELDEIRTWMIDNITRFTDVFRPHLEQIRKSVDTESVD